MKANYTYILLGKKNSVQAILTREKPLNKIEIYEIKYSIATKKIIEICERAVRCIN